MKIKKIEDKKELDVLAQWNCTVKGKTPEYVAGQDCLDDCTAYGEEEYYKNKHL
jgi:hypothetical protein